MQFVKGLFQNLGSLITETEDQNGMNYQLRTHSLSNRDAQMTLPLSNGDVRFDLDGDDDDYDLMNPVQEEEEEEDVFDSGADIHFIEAYRAYMANYYGRPARYRTDLFCAMFPVDIMDPSVDEFTTMRYWWFSIKHPVCRALDNHFSALGRNVSEGTFASGLYGDCVIYSDEVIEYFVEMAMELCKSIGLELEDVRSAYAAQKPVSSTFTSKPDAKEDMPSIIYEAISRPEGSKKAD